MPHSLLALVLTSTLGAAPSPELTVRYEPAGSPRAEHARQVLKDSGALKIGIKLPKPVEVVARDCDEPSATWDGEDRRITICYSLVGKIRRTLTGIAQTEEADARTTNRRVDGALTALFHHELGHAQGAMKGLPGGASRADQFAALTLASEPPKRVAAAAEARHLLAEHTGLDDLSGPEEAATFACLLYGADPAKHVRIAQGGWVPAERAPTCADEYNRVKSAIG
ncbi:DUF4344 domain-containing metallopeptidase [Nonomuraea turcica]|uniref:DUF4344 domain-containing metallopeptidase n=1 Tax=Nonomuraea sp. G32 TaxID=3067274 RepID=UPI00273C21B5|nr:DUF4344 domain-containing metallopeptidase [Nonomuraea sp. G32]MDP4504851.1 DUF4344 domain-containing metallopeptidase [Nonomuraea sp. G32]